MPREQAIFRKRPAAIDEALAGINADGWTVVAISGGDQIIHLLCERDAPVTSTETLAHEIRLVGRVVADLTPADKVVLIEAMGFTRMHDDHQPDCPYAISGGNRCSCVMPPDVYTLPADVARHLGQDYESLRIASSRPRPIPDVER